MHKIEVPLNYRPNITSFFRNDRKRWQLEYDLPSVKKIRMTWTLPEDTSSRSMNRILDGKSSDLSRGLLTDKEFNRLLEDQGGISIAEGLKKYLDLTALGKGSRAQGTDRTRVPRVFSYFMSSEAFLNANALIEGKSESENESGVKPIGYNMKEFAIQNGCKQIGFEFTRLSEIKEEHVLKYRTYLLAEVEKRKGFEKEMRSKWFNASAEERKELIAEKAKTGFSPMTARGNFVTLKKVFNALKCNKEVDSDPTVDVPNIKLTEKDSVRSTTPTHDQINKILKCDYESDVRTGFLTKIFFFFLKETGARLGEALHLEWTDIENGIWKIRRKENCPTQHGIGWSPKWGKERDIVLTPLALRMLSLIPKAVTVGYITNDETPYPAQFVFTIKDRGLNKPEGQRRRVDKIGKSWRGLLKAAGVPYEGPEKLILHDTRRFKNMENEHVKNKTLQERCEELGNSARVNQSNYKGVVDPKIQAIQAQISQLQAMLFEYNGGDEISYLADQPEVLSKNPERTSA